MLFLEFYLISYFKLDPICTEPSNPDKDLGVFCMLKYDYEFKLKLVKENEEGYGIKFLSKKYNIKVSTIKNWIQKCRISGEEGLRKSISKTKYTGEFKLSVLQYRQYNGLSYSETAKYFEINNPSLIANWTRKYEEEGFEGLNNTIGRSKKKEETSMPKNIDDKKLNKSEREELLELREKTQYLEAENLYLKKLDALIRKKESQTKKKQK